MILILIRSCQKQWIVKHFNSDTSRTVISKICTIPQIVLIGRVCCCFYCASRFKELIFRLKLFLFRPYCILEEILFLTKIIALFANSFAYFGAGIARHNSQKYWCKNCVKVALIRRVVTSVTSSSSAHIRHLARALSNS